MLKHSQTNIVTLEAELQQMDARHKEDQTKFVEMERQKNVSSIIGLKNSRLLDLKFFPCRLL